jgi:DeoR/GlpR family transcriptional regulator of sugar metabolism
VQKPARRLPDDRATRPVRAVAARAGAPYRRRRSGAVDLRPRGLGTQRLETETRAKRLLADAAVELLAQRDAVFLDPSTSSYFVARRIIDLGFEITIVTNSLPIGQLVAAQAPTNVELVCVGGLLRTLSQSFVGPHAIGTIERHFTDHASTTRSSPRRA